MHGPGPITPTNPLGWQPKYRPPLQVVDSVAHTLTREHRKLFWRPARDLALSWWGLPFEVTEGIGPEYDVNDPGKAAMPGKIRLIRGNRVSGSGYHPTDFAWYDPTKDGSYAVDTPWAPWWRFYYRQQMASTICHEVGHCLGLWHRTDNGVMAGGIKPDSHDIESVGAYYLA